MATRMTNRTHRVRSARTSTLAIGRSTGAMTGSLLMLLGIWGALIPFVGHYFGYGFTPDATWQWTAARGWLEVAPGAATFLAGMLISSSGNRATTVFSGLLAAAAGGWFVLGPIATPLWSPGSIGIPVGGAAQQFLERVGMFSGLGALIVLFAAIAIGRATAVAAKVADSQLTAETSDDVYPASTQSANTSADWPSATSDDDTVATTPISRQPI